MNGLIRKYLMENIFVLYNKMRMINILGIKIFYLYNYNFSVFLCIRCKKKWSRNIKLF